MIKDICHQMSSVFQLLNMYNFHDSSNRFINYIRDKPETNTFDYCYDAIIEGFHRYNVPMVEPVMTEGNKSLVSTALKNNDIFDAVNLICDPDFMAKFPLGELTVDQTDDSRVVVPSGSQVMAVVCPPCVTRSKYRPSHDYFLNVFSKNGLRVRPMFEETTFNYNKLKRNYKHLFLC